MPGSVAVANYNSAGALQTWQEEIVSTRHLTIVGQRVTTSSGRVQTGSQFINPPAVDPRQGWLVGRRPDPLAQSFFVR